MPSNELCTLVVALLKLYLGIGLTGIGFAFMLAGKNGGASVAQFYFGGAVRWLVTHVGAIVRWIMYAIAALLTRVIAWSWFGLLEPVLRQLAQVLWHAVRWLFGTGGRLTTALALVILCALTLVALAGPAGAQTVTLQASEHGMFYTDVTLNDRLRVRALIDTGATYLSLCHTTGSALQLPLGESLPLSTANGIITGRRTTVASVRIGAIEVRNVAAVVDTPKVPCNDRVLIGMTVLRQLHVTVDSDKLMLAKRGSLLDAAERWLVVALLPFALLSLIGIAIGRRRMSWQRTPGWRSMPRAKTQAPPRGQYALRMHRRWA